MDLTLDLKKIIFYFVDKAWLSSKKKGMIKKNKKIPKINFQILIPDTNIIIIPSKKILIDVPKSGWIMTKKKGIRMINNGKNKYITEPIFWNLKEW